MKREAEAKELAPHISRDGRRDFWIPADVGRQICSRWHREPLSKIYSCFEYSQRRSSPEKAADIAASLPSSSQSKLSRKSVWLAESG